MPTQLVIDAFLDVLDVLLRVLELLSIRALTLAGRQHRKGWRGSD